MALTIAELSGLGSGPLALRASAEETGPQVLAAKREVARIRAMYDNARNFSPDQLPGVAAALRSAEGALQWARMSDSRERRARIMETLTSPTAARLPSGMSTPAWLERAEATGGAGTPRHSSYYGTIPSMVKNPDYVPPRLSDTALATFGGQLSYSEYMRLKREFPDLLRDWLRSGRYTLPAGIQFPGDTTPAMVSRGQRGQLSRERAPDWAALEQTREAARLQSEEMARRGARTYRPETWTNEPIGTVTGGDPQAERLKGLTKDSAVFRAMSNYQKIQYLTRVKGTFKGNAAFENMLARYTRMYNKEMLGSKEMIAAAMERSDPASDIRQDQLRKQAAGAQARAWLNQVRSRGAEAASTIPGYDRIPHKPASVMPQITPMPVFTMPAFTAPRPTTGGGVVYGQPYAQQAQQYSHGSIVAGNWLPPMTYTGSAK